MGNIKSDNKLGYKSMMNFKIYSILFLLFLYGIPNEGLQAARVFEPDKAISYSKLIVYEEFELIEGVEVGDINFWEELITGSYSRRRVIQLKDGSTHGRAEIAFFEPSAKYNITVTYVEAKKPGAELSILINGKKIGAVKYGDSHSFRERTFENVNVQEWSKILLEFTGTKENRCRVEKIVFTPAGAFEGQSVKLEKPVTLKVFESNDEVQKGRKIFHDYVVLKLEEADRQRSLEIAGIGNSLEEEPVGARWQDRGIEKWKARQDEIRKNLSSYFGEFPEKTPLNPVITGKLEYEKYTIEKVIFESQPGFFVTANLYVPKGRQFPVPGVVFPLGHSDAGKSRDAYHMSGLGMVLKGYVVLVFDPIGQGERSEYIDEKNNWLVHLGVDQHWYVGRPAFLANWTLSGLRTWDGIRAVDYLVSRPEVDKNKLAAVGCSGGGQMALLITAVDERIKVCAASHPGGPMENTYLTGKNLTDKEIYSLIPPRPLRIIVGNESGEEPRHREYLEDMQIFYEGFRVGRNSAELDMVPGPHSMNRSNRESAYEWLNKWFDKEIEGKAEDINLRVEKEEDLWCTESGNVLVSLGSETGQTLNSKRAVEIYKPEKDTVKLKENIARRIGLELQLNEEAPSARTYELLKIEGMTVEKLTYESETGIVIPSLLIKPEKLKQGSPLYIYVSENGKPTGYQSQNIPFLLAKEGYIVFAVDVRGTGETSPVPSFASNRFTGFTPMLRINDDLAIESAGFGKTTLGMRTQDIMKGIDFIKTREDLQNRRIVVIGQGLGGLWAVTAAAFDERINGVVTIGTLPSYKPLIENMYYNNTWGYFWLPGALKDFDIPDVTKLSSSGTQLWIDPINQLGETDAEGARKYLNQRNLSIIKSTGELLTGTVKSITSHFK
jgi:cephalosporin-C deacetylase-like acetyl esterase